MQEDRRFVECILNLNVFNEYTIGDLHVKFFKIFFSGPRL